MIKTLAIATISTILSFGSSVAQTRLILSADLNLYMDATPTYSCPGANCMYGVGNDANDCLTAQTPCATAARLNEVVSGYDVAGHRIKVILASAPASTCSGVQGCATKIYPQSFVIPPLVGQIPGRVIRGCNSPDFVIGTGVPAFSIVGSDPANPIGAFIQPPAPLPGQSTKAAISVTPGADGYVSGVGMESTVANADTIDAFGDLVIDQVLFGGAGGAQVAVGPHSWILVNGPIRLDAAGTSWAQIGPTGRLDFNTNSQVACAVSFTFYYPMHFSQGFVNIDDGGVGFFSAINFINKQNVTGTSAVLAGNAALVINGYGTPPAQGYLPGSGINLPANYLPTGPNGTGPFQAATPAQMIR